MLNCNTDLQTAAMPTPVTLPVFITNSGDQPCVPLHGPYVQWRKAQRNIIRLS